MCPGKTEVSPIGRIGGRIGMREKTLRAAGALRYSQPLRTRAIMVRHQKTSFGGFRVARDYRVWRLFAAPQAPAFSHRGSQYLVRLIAEGACPW